MQHPVTTEYEAAARSTSPRRCTRSTTSDSRRCGSGRTSTPAPTARRAASAAFREIARARRTSTSSRTWRRPTSCGSLYNSELPRRQLERRHPRVLVPRRPGRNIGSRQAGRERGANVIDVDYDRDEIVEAVRSTSLARARPVATRSTATARPASASPSVLADGAAHDREAADLLTTFQSRSDTGREPFAIGSPCADVGPAEGDGARCAGPAGVVHPHGAVLRGPGLVDVARVVCRRTDRRRNGGLTP